MMAKTQLICQTIKSQGFFICDGNIYQLIVPLSIYDNEEDKTISPK